MGFLDWIKGKNKDNSNKKNLEVQEESNIKEEQIQEENDIKEEQIQEENDIQEEQIQEENNIQEEQIQEENDIKEEQIQEENNIQGEQIQEENNKKDKKTFGFFEKIKSGLKKTRNNIISGVENVLKSFTKIDEELFEELEEALIMADIGVETSVFIIEKVKEIVKKEKITDVLEVKNLIINVITDMLKQDDNEFNLKSPAVILVIGVNGVGKTTTIGKLANNFKKQNKKVLLAAADTFRAAAIDQLEVWGERNNVDVIKHQENSDPGAVVYDAVQAAKSRKTDILICDTAGRLHNKKNLMEELKKIFRIISREYSQAQLEVFLVLDATTGQNALQQAKLFKETADITGLILTKLDGTAKGGIIISIKNELNIPVRYIGVGESIDDLQPFDAEQFSSALFSND